MATEASNTYGRVFAKSRYANTTLTYMDIGIQLFMCLYGLSIFLEGSKEARKGKLGFILMSFAIFVTSAIPAVIDSVEVAKLLLDAGPTGSDILQTWRETHTLSWMGIFSTVMLLLYIGIGDALMIWRCSVVWDDHKWVVIPPVLSLIASTASGIASLCMEKESVAAALAVSTVLCSVGVSIMVTILIIGRLIHRRQGVLDLFPNRKPSRMYTSAVATLVEAAAPLAIFGIALAVITLVRYFTVLSDKQRPHWRVAYDVFSLLYYSFSVSSPVGSYPSRIDLYNQALSPQMIIFRVTSGKSWKKRRREQK
ncbi:hypothetical protein BKA70DRAFT_1188727 [Coprinopsis sp. MPI-PUGE-AT-0042]|nr:hypothetical protein BKA70DRAFT_1188727 [Coprinopsis sp. MPI-PUGE-AT-0042]